MKRIILSFFAMALCLGAFAQEETVDELKAMKAEKEAAVAALQGEIGSLNDRIANYPGWKFASFGTIGGSLSSFNNWAKGANPNSIATTFGGTFNVSAKLNETKSFWDNNLGLAVGWQELDTNTDDDVETGGFQAVTDNLRFTSLYGYKLSEKLAISALGDYNTAIINNFNAPGILDIGVGATWTPIQNLRVVVHPLNYHIVFLPEGVDTQSALGAKIVADYSRELIPGLAWRTNLAAFVPYGSNDPNPSLFEYTWTNGLGFNLWKGIGVGIDFAIRQADIETTETQSYFIIGVSYAL